MFLVSLDGSKHVLVDFYNGRPWAEKKRLELRETAICTDMELVTPGMDIDMDMNMDTTIAEVRLLTV
jgi:hypothetical protein